MAPDSSIPNSVAMWGCTSDASDERFPFEAGQAFWVGSVAVRENLQRDFTTEAGIAGAIDFAHPALAQQLDNFEGPRRRPGSNDIGVPRIICLSSRGGGGGGRNRWPL